MRRHKCPPIISFFGAGTTEAPPPALLAYTLSWTPRDFTSGLSSRNSSGTGQGTPSLPHAHVILKPGHFGPGPGPPHVQVRPVPTNDHAGPAHPKFRLRAALPALESRPEAESNMASRPGCLGRWRSLRWREELTSLFVWKTSPDAFSHSSWTSDWGSARTRTAKPCVSHSAQESSDSRRDPVSCLLYA